MCRSIGYLLGALLVFDRSIDAQELSRAVTPQGRPSQVYCVAFSSDGKWLASASVDRRVKVWDASSWQETFTLKERSGSYVSLAFSPDGKRIVSIGLDNMVKIWDSANGQGIFTLKGQ